MAKIGFTKLGLKTNQEIQEIEINGQIIEVKQYLPINEKLALIGEVLGYSADENNFANPLKVEAYSTIGIIEKYTNINFTEKQKEDIPKLYDLIAGAGIDTVVKAAIPERELCALERGLFQTIDAFYTYRSSALGILDTLSTNYDNVDFDLTKLQEKISDPNTFELLREIGPLLNGLNESM